MLWVPLAVHPDSRSVPAAPTAPRMQLTQLGKTVPEATRVWFAEQVELTIRGGVFTAPPFTPNGTSGPLRPRLKKGAARYYSPDNASDPRTHYNGTFIRDFFYTFSMAGDVVHAEDIGNTLDYFFSGQDTKTGSVSEGGYPPNPPINYVDCWDEGSVPAIRKPLPTEDLLICSRTLMECLVPPRESARGR